MTRHRSTGFTLIELMFTLVIIGILAGMVYPSYMNYTRQARRSDGQVAIQQTANRLEKFAGYCNTYMSGSVTFISAPWPTSCPPVPAGTGLGLASELSPERHYRISIAADNAAGSCATGPCNALAGTQLTMCLQQCGYTITADPNGDGTTSQQRNDGRLRMDSRGIKQWDKNNDGSYAANEHSWK